MAQTIMTSLEMLLMDGVRLLLLGVILAAVACGGKSRAPQADASAVSSASSTPSPIMQPEAFASVEPEPFASADVMAASDDYFFLMDAALFASRLVDGMTAVAQELQLASSLDTNAVHLVRLEDVINKDMVVTVDEVEPPSDSVVVGSEIFRVRRFGDGQAAGLDIAAAKAPAELVAKWSFSASINAQTITAVYPILSAERNVLVLHSIVHPYLLSEGETLQVKPSPMYSWHEGVSNLLTWVDITDPLRPFTVKTILVDGRVQAKKRIDDQLFIVSSQFVWFNFIISDNLEINAVVSDPETLASVLPQIRVDRAAAINDLDRCWASDSEVPVAFVTNITAVDLTTGGVRDRLCLNASIRALHWYGNHVYLSGSSSSGQPETWLHDFALDGSIQYQGSVLLEAPVDVLPPAAETIFEL